MLILFAWMIIMIIVIIVSSIVMEVIGEFQIFLRKDFISIKSIKSIRRIKCIKTIKRVKSIKGQTSDFSSS